MLFFGWRIGAVVLFYVADAVLLFLFTGIMLAIVGGRRGLIGVPIYFTAGSVGMLLGCGMVIVFTAIIDQGHGRLPEFFATHLNRDAYWAAAILAAGHGAAFCGDFLWRGRFRRQTWEQVRDRMAVPMLTFFIVGFGLMASNFFGLGGFATVVIGGKTALDLRLFAINLEDKN